MIATGQAFCSDCFQGQEIFLRLCSRQNEICWYGHHWRNELGAVYDVCDGEDDVLRRGCMFRLEGKLPDGAGIQPRNIQDV